METLAEFDARFCKDINCYCHPCRSGIFSLKKRNTDIKPMGVFGWVEERKRKEMFIVSSLKELADKARVGNLGDLIKRNYQWKKDGILFYVKSHSIGDDYQKTIKALKAIIEIKP